MNPTHLPFKLEILTPCHQSWQSMFGDSTQRHCACCNKQVHNLVAMTPLQIEELIHNSGGHLCARITRNALGELVTVPEPSPVRLKAALLATAMATAIPAVAQSSNATSAIVTGKILDPQTAAPSVGAQVLFIQDSNQIYETQTDSNGKFHAEVLPGTYDIVMRKNAMFGQRVTAVQLHPGEQSFAPIQATFNFGHLGLVNKSEGDTATIGEVVSMISGMSLRYAVRHPMSYLAMMKRRVVRS